jgi:hypothetical protein
MPECPLMIVNVATHCIDDNGFTLWIRAQTCYMYFTPTVYSQTKDSLRLKASGILNDCEIYIDDGPVAYFKDVAGLRAQIDINTRGCDDTYFDNDIKQTVCAKYKVGGIKIGNLKPPVRVEVSDGFNDLFLCGRTTQQGGTA